MINPAVLITAILVLNTNANLLDEISLEYQDTLHVFGKGRRSERDLPVCESEYEACNLAHHRLWLTPITERLCRCPRRAQCPLSYESQDTRRSQHVSNRAQLKFCEQFDEAFAQCEDGQPGAALLTDSGVDRTGKRTSPPLTRTTLSCRCSWPRMLILNRTTTKPPSRTIQTYVCQKLPKASTNEVCGRVRKDTYEVYYTKSCPKDHLCVINAQRKSQPVELMHFQDEAYSALCTTK